jgi:hypothetical protein
VIDVNAMDDIRLRIKVATLLGWTYIEATGDGHAVGHAPDINGVQLVPDYPNDIAAAWLLTGASSLDVY